MTAYASAAAATPRNATMCKPPIARPRRASGNSSLIIVTATPNSAARKICAELWKSVNETTPDETAVNSVKSV